MSPAARRAARNLPLGSRMENDRLPSAVPSGSKASRAEREAARVADHNRRLTEAEERLRRIIDSIADAVVVVDREGLVKFANPAAGALFGRPREQVIGDHFGLPVIAGETTEVDLHNGGVAEMRMVEILWE